MQTWTFLTTWPTLHNVNSTLDLHGNLSSDDPRNATKDPCTYEKHNWLFAKVILISIIGTTIALLGIIGNLTTILVLTRPAMRTPNNLYLTFLAIFDTMLLISAIVLYSIEYIYEYTDNLTLYTIWLQYVRYGFALSHVAQTGSVYITVAVTFERLLAVLFPRRAKVMCTHDKASLTILIVVIFSMLFNATKYFEVEVIYIENCTGFGAQHMVASSLLRDEIYQTVHSLWLTQLVMVFIPFIVLLAVNTAIVWRVRKSLKKLSWIQRGRKRDQLKEKSRDATRILIVIVMVFLLCNTLGFVVTLMENLYGQDGLLQWCPGFYAFAREVVNFLAIVNSSINFIIYCIFGQDFRHELVCIWGCKSFFFMLPVGDKFTAERLMVNPRLHRSASMFARYVGLIRQTSNTELPSNALRKARKKKEATGNGVANLRGILASVQAEPYQNGVNTSGPHSTQNTVIITNTNAEDEYRPTDSQEDLRTELQTSWDDQLTCEEFTNFANGGFSVGVYYLNNWNLTPVKKGKTGISHSNSAVTTSCRERIPSHVRRRCSSSISAPDSKCMSEKLRHSASSCCDSEPLAPFLLGMLVSAPNVRQAGIETALKNYDIPDTEEVVWV